MDNIKNKYFAKLAAAIDLTEFEFSSYESACKFIDEDNNYTEEHDQARVSLKIEAKIRYLYASYVIHYVNKLTAFKEELYSNQNFIYEYILESTRNSSICYDFQNITTIFKFVGETENINDTFENNTDESVSVKETLKAYALARVETAIHIFEFMAEK